MQGAQYLVDTVAHPHMPILTVRVQLEDQREIREGGAGRETKPWKLRCKRDVA